MQPPTSGDGVYYPAGPQPVSGFPSYPGPPQQAEGRSTLPLPEPPGYGAPVGPGFQPPAGQQPPPGFPPPPGFQPPGYQPPFGQGPGLPGQGPGFPPGAPKKPSRAPLIIGGVLALLLVGALSFTAGYFVGHSGKSSNNTKQVAAAPLASKQPSTASTSSAPTSSASASAASITGAWTGSYTCNQGKTGLVIAFAGTNDNLFAAFSFYALSENPNVPSGEFIMKGTYEGGKLSLKGDHWIKQPTGYNLVDLESTSVTATQITGTIDATGCTGFTVSRS